MRLADGRVVYINPQAVSVGNHRIAIFGKPNYVWARTQTSGEESPPSDRALGFITDPDGNATMVYPPAGKGVVMYPRLAPAASGGWHVVFVRRLSEQAATGTHLDSAQLWYARYDGSAWRDLELIANVSNAALENGVSSALVRDGDQLAFAFGFDNAVRTHSNAPGNQGIVLVHGRLSNWRLDTLRTALAPNYVQLAPAHLGSGLLVVSTQPYFDAMIHPRASALFLADYSGGWRNVRLAAADSSEPLHALQVNEGSGMTLISWSTSGVHPVVEDAMLTSANASTPVRRDTAFSGSPAWNAFVLRPDLVVWTTPAKEAAASSRVITVHGLTKRAQELPIANRVGNQAGIRLGDSDLLLVGSSLARGLGDPPAQTVLTRLRVFCN